MKRVEKRLLASVALVAFSLGTPNIGVSAGLTYWDPQNGSTDFFDSNNWTGGNGPEGYDTYFKQGTAFGIIDSYAPGYRGQYNLAEQIGYGAGSVANIHIKIVAPYGGNPDGNEISYDNEPNLGENFFLGSDGAIGKLTLEIEGNARVQNYRTETINIGSGRDGNGTLTLIGSGKNADVIPEGPLFYGEDVCSGAKCGSSFNFAGTREFKVGAHGGTGLMTIENAAVYMGGGEISIGSGAGSIGTVNILSNGKLGVSSNESTRDGLLFVGLDGGTGTLNVGNPDSVLTSRVGTSVFVSGSGITLGSGDGSQGQLNIRPNAMAHTLINTYYARSIADGDISRSELETRLGVNGGLARAIVAGEGAVWYQSGLLTEDRDYQAPNDVQASRYISDQGIMHVGVSGEAELIIADKGQVRIGSADMLRVRDRDNENNEYYYETMELKNHVADGTLILGEEVSGKGVLSIGGGIGQGAKAAGRLMAKTLEFGEGEGIVRFNHTQNDYVFDQFDNTFLKFTDSTGTNATLQLKGNGRLDAAAGRTILNEDHLNFTGVVNPTTGTLQVNGDLSAATGKISKDGALEGTGSIGNVVNAGILAPGKTLNELHGGDHASIGTFTIKGDYKGENGFIYIDTILGGDNSETDLLVIEGDTSGKSLVRVTNINGGGAQTQNGIKIIQVGGKSDGDFQLSSSYTHNDKAAVVAGAYAYKLFKGGKTDPNDGDWYLRSELNKTKPQYQAGAPVYEVYPQFLLGLNNLPTMQQRVGNRYWNNAGNMVIAQGADAVEAYAPAQEAGNLTQTNGVWGRIEGAYTKMEPNTSTTDANYDFNAYKMQAGLDGMIYENEQGKLIAGGTVHYTHGLASVWSPYDADLGRGRIQTDGYGFGATLTWAGDDGFYVDNQVQLTWYRSDLSYAGGKSQLKDGKNNGFGYALSSEVGQRFALDQHWSLTPQAQLQYSNVDFSDFTDVFGADVSRKKGDSLRGRLGLSVDYQNSWQNAQGLTNRSSVYGIVNLYNEFLSGTKVRVSTEDFINKSERFWGGIGLGGSYNWDNDKYSIYGEGSVNTSLQHFGDSYNYKGTLGVRVKW